MFTYFWHPFNCRGALTGKFKKGDKEAPQGSRLELGTKMKLPELFLPDIDELIRDEKYWAIRDVLDKIAKKKGSLFLNPNKYKHSKALQVIVVGSDLRHDIEFNLDKKALLVRRVRGETSIQVALHVASAFVFSFDL